ncbi:MAG: hypothetical protein CL678_15250 [Bdellovibrionaceae bacterium]|nr:hypothetical protein [Pseudobdellovibrionaceae bacterium]|tara:strand:+ start:1473 stop:2309 length:837 start_codon:yes stop_codon:yes gene_type:complete
MARKSKNVAAYNAKQAKQDQAEKNLLGGGGASAGKQPAGKKPRARRKQRIPQPSKPEIPKKLSDDASEDEINAFLAIDFSALKRKLKKYHEGQMHKLVAKLVVGSQDGQRGFAFPREAILRVVRDLVNEVAAKVLGGANIRMNQGAFTILRLKAEEYLVQWFNKLQILAQHAGRVTIGTNDADTLELLSSGKLEVSQADPRFIRDMKMMENRMADQEALKRRFHPNMQVNMQVNMQQGDDDDGAGPAELPKSDDSDSDADYAESGESESDTSDESDSD